ncbi:MAG TPA: DUF5818 domain-containing protein, partial [Thermoanaerobaculia bacterium]
PNDRYAPNGPGQPPPLQNEPNGQYGPNGQGQPPPPQYDPNGGQYDNQPSDDQNGDDRGAPQSISVDGTLDFNGTCPTVRDRNGTSYDLAGNLRGFHNGERVRVTGLLSGSSSCGGTALEIQEIRERR